VALTDAGEALLPEARATLAAAQAAVDAVGEARGGLRGTVTVGTMLSTGTLDLPELLGRFHATHSAVIVRLRLAAAGSADLAREVVSGSLDLAIASLPGHPPGELTVRPVNAENLVLACDLAHPLAARPQRRWTSWLASRSSTSRPAGATGRSWTARSRRPAWTVRSRSRWLTSSPPPAWSAPASGSRSSPPRWPPC